MILNRMHSLIFSVFGRPTIRLIGPNSGEETTRTNGNELSRDGNLYRSVSSKNLIGAANMKSIALSSRRAHLLSRGAQTLIQ